jgi:hypothetical protein
MTGYTDTYSDFYGLTTAQILGDWGYTAYIYIAFDPPTAVSPAWIDVTGYVDLEAANITITRGRADGLSDVSTGTCTLTVDNSDGRWSPFNPSGPWYGQIRKGSWLRIDVLPPSGTVSTRFVGFIQQLPVSWSGRYSTVQISASDRFALLGNANPYQTAIAEEWLNDPIAGQYLIGYWPLHEPAGSTYVSDVSGLAPAGQTTLAVRNQGVNAGTALTFANQPAPGYDSASTVTFTPSGTPTNFFGTSGPYPNGSYLQGNIGPNGNVAVVSCWIQTTSLANQPIWSWTDPASNYGLWAGLLGGTLGGGPFVLTQYPLNGVTTNIGNINSVNFSNINLADGNWHQIVAKIQTVAGTNFANHALLQVWIDGDYSFGYFTGPGITVDIIPPATLSRFTLGGAESWLLFNTTYLPTGQVALFQGSISDLAIASYPSNTVSPDFYGTYQAGTRMWQSPGLTYSLPESCGRRVLRLASFAGLPVPEATSTPLGTTVKDVTVGTSSTVNIPAETAHLAGFQQISGSTPLTAMLTAAHTENMPLFIDRQGRLTLQPSTLRQNPTTPAFSIDAADLDPSTTWADDFQYFTNQAVITPSGLGSLTVNTNGTISQNLNGLYSKSLDTVTVNAAESASLGAAVNYAGSNPPPRVAPLAVEAATLAGQTGYGNAWYDAVLAAEISTVIQVTDWAAGTPGPSTSTHYIEGYTETLGMGTHLIAWNVSATQGATYQCDSPTLGVIDTPGLTLAY